MDPLEKQFASFAENILLKVKSAVDSGVAALSERVARMEGRIDALQVRDGEDGKDGKSVRRADVQQLVDDAVLGLIDHLPKPKEIDVKAIVAEAVEIGEKRASEKYEKRLKKLEGHKALTVDVEALVAAMEKRFTLSFEKRLKAIEGNKALALDVAALEELSECVDRIKDEALANLHKRIGRLEGDGHKSAKARDASTEALQSLDDAVADSRKRLKALESRNPPEVDENALIQSTKLALKPIVEKMIADRPGARAETVDYDRIGVAVDALVDRQLAERIKALPKPAAAEAVDYDRIGIAVDEMVERQVADQIKARPQPKVPGVDYPAILERCEQEIDDRFKALPAPKARSIDYDLIKQACAPIIEEAARAAVSELPPVHPERLDYDKLSARLMSDMAPSLRKELEKTVKALIAAKLPKFDVGELTDTVDTRIAETVKSEMQSLPKPDVPSKEAIRLTIKDELEKQTAKDFQYIENMVSGKIAEAVKPYENGEAH